MDDALFGPKKTPSRGSTPKTPETSVVKGKGTTAPKTGRRARSAIPDNDEDAATTNASKPVSEPESFLSSHVDDTPAKPKANDPLDFLLDSPSKDKPADKASSKPVDDTQPTNKGIMV